MVCSERAATGHLHCHLGSVHLYIRHLFQIVRNDGKKKMSIDLVYLAIFVFLLMFLGLFMTVVEFKKLNDQETDRAGRPEAGPDSKP